MGLLGLIRLSFSPSQPLEVGGVGGCHGMKTLRHMYLWALEILEKLKRIFKSSPCAPSMYLSPTPANKSDTCQILFLVIRKEHFANETIMIPNSPRTHTFHDCWKGYQH